MQSPNRYFCLVGIIVMVHHEVAGLQSLCLSCLENFVSVVSLSTSRLIIKLVPDVTEEDDLSPENSKEVVHQL